MEIVHDRERERYSKHVSRTFTRGTYYLEVNANHPDYILRTRVLPVPPYDDPAQAVEAGMHYIMNVGDAWFAQVPREGNIYVRAANMHDTATRCTACHPSSFSTEANLIAHRNGYPIRSKSNFQYVIDRLYNSITPLYGDDGLVLAAIHRRSRSRPRESREEFCSISSGRLQGKQTRTVERFGPFLAASVGMPQRPAAGRAQRRRAARQQVWLCLARLAGAARAGRRTGRDDFAKAAARIAAILGDRAADRRIETLQDRIHRLYAWWLFDKKLVRQQDQARDRCPALLAKWRRRLARGRFRAGPRARSTRPVSSSGRCFGSACRATIRPWPKHCATCWKQQQDFGGWFQTTTHENFRTPMRETRYAVMALAEAFPRAGSARRGWGNRDLGPARLPRSDSLVHTLDDLENLWEVPEPDRPRFARAIDALLDHPEPLVRAAAAACLGRLGQAESAAPLVKRLDDPSKIVWRRRPGHLRNLGNAGARRRFDQGRSRRPQSADPPRRHPDFRLSILRHGSPARPGRALIELSQRPRSLDAPSGDANLAPVVLPHQRSRPSRGGSSTPTSRGWPSPISAVVRKNLSEGLYIMLDENLGGGVSLQNNLEELPAAMRPRILDARRVFERDVLLTPVLAALERGNDLQRAAVLEGFDGSFFKGRFYARQPEAMIDVGNDREFGFLYQPDLGALETTFTRLLTAESAAGGAAAKPAARRLLPAARSGPETPRSRWPCCERLTDPDTEVREAARRLVATSLEPSGAEDDPQRIALLRSVLEGTRRRPRGRPASDRPKPTTGGTARDLWTRSAS